MYKMISTLVSSLRIWATHAMQLMHCIALQYTQLLQQANKTMHLMFQYDATIFTKRSELSSPLFRLLSIWNVVCVQAQNSCLLHTPAQTKPTFSLRIKEFANTSIQIYGRSRKIFFDCETNQRRKLVKFKYGTWGATRVLGMKGDNSEDMWGDN